MLESFVFAYTGLENILTTNFYIQAKYIEKDFLSNGDMSLCSVLQEFQLLVMN